MSTAEFAADLMRARRTVLPRRLVAPGPGDDDLARIFAAAATAPDHDQRLPWRFVIVHPGARAALGEVFAAHLRERDPSASDEEMARAREKAFRAPTLLLALVCTAPPGDAIPTTERFVSAGCAIQNLLLMATALGFGSALTSGKALHSPGLRALFALAPLEQPLCFISLGTVGSAGKPRARPVAADFVRELDAPGEREPNDQFRRGGAASCSGVVK